MRRADDLRDAIAGVRANARPNDKIFDYGEHFVPKTGIIQNLTGNHSLESLTRDMALERANKLGAYVPLSPSQKAFLITYPDGVVPRPAPGASMINRTNQQTPGSPVIPNVGGPLQSPLLPANGGGADEDNQ